MLTDSRGRDTSCFGGSVRLPGGSLMNHFVSLVSSQILDQAQETEMVSVPVPPPFEGVVTPVLTWCDHALNVSLTSCFESTLELLL